MAHVVDVRNGDGVFAVLGTALTLPSSTSNSSNQLPGSLRFNPATETIQYYSTVWNDISASSGGGGGLSSITATGDATGSNTGNNLPLTLATVMSAGTYSNITVDAKGRVINATPLSQANVVAALGFTPANITSPTFLGNPQAPILPITDSSASIATSSFTQSLILSTTRIRLNTALTLYVSTSGSDNNSGLTTQTAFATINKAWQVLLTKYDLNGYNATIQIEDGTYPPVQIGGQPVGLTGSNQVSIVGNTATSTNVIISQTAYGAAFTVQGPTTLTITGFSLTAPYGDAIFATGGVNLNVETIDFGACSATASHVQCAASVVSMDSAYTISGKAGSHLLAGTNGAIIQAPGCACTINGSFDFPNGFAYAITGTIIVFPGMVYSANGYTFGLRSNATLNGTINTNGQTNGQGGTGESFFPGSQTGISSSGGQYA